MPDAAEFDALTAEFYEVWFHYHPDLAQQVGVPVAGRRLPAQDDDDLAALRGWLAELLLALDEIEFSALDADRQLDWELLAGAARVEHRELADGCDWRRLDPLRCLPSVEFEWLAWGPSQARSGPLTRLLSEMPDHLRQAQVRLRAAAARLPPVLVRVAVRQAQHGRRLLRELACGPGWQRDGEGQAGLAALLTAADEALAGYQHCLSEDLAPRARGRLGCGADLLGLRLREVHFIDCDPAGGAEAIVRVLEQAERALADPSGTPEPITGSALPAAVAVGLADPAAGAADPRDDGRGHQIALTDPARQAARARRLPRRLANDASLAVGWHLYLGRHLARTAAGGGEDYRQALAAQRERMWLARLDLDLHTGRIDDAAVLNRLQGQGLAGPVAEARLAHLARHPGEALAGVLGWQLLERARACQVALGGAAVAEHDFHDRLVSHGSIPVPLALRYSLGDALWQAAYAGVLGGDPGG